MRTQTVIVGALVMLALLENALARTTNGTVNFCNNRSNVVFFLQNNYPVAAGNGIKAALYWAPVGSNDFVRLGAAATIGVPVPGIFAGGTREAGPATRGGAMGQFQVRAWGGPYATYEQAFTNGGYCSGVSTIITMPTGNPTNAAPLPPVSLVAGGFQGFGLGQSPIILVPPTNQVVGIGRTAGFTVAATGTSPLSYQWQFNGANLTDSAHIAGSLTPALTILNVQTNDAGTYRVVVMNLYGVTVSSGADLTVVRLCVPPPAGLIAWWKGEGNANDSAGRADGVLYRGVTFAPGEVGQCFSFDGINSAVNVPDVPALALTNSLTIECWLFVTNGPTVPGMVLFRGDTRSGLDPYYLSVEPNGGAGSLNFIVVAPSNTGTSVSTVMPLGAWTHVAATLDNATGLMRLYTNAVLAAQKITTLRPLGPLNPGSRPGVGIGNHSSQPAPFNYPFRGRIDEVSLYDRALTAAEILDLYNARTDGKCLAVPPVITVPPTNQSVFPGSNAVFSVLAGGSPALSYQWRFNGTNTLAATTETLTITNAQLTNVGDYQVIITNTYGSATSPVAALALVLPPRFQSISVQTGTLTMTWNGAAGITYQVQYKTNVIQRYWSNLGSSIFATGNVVTAHDIISSDRQRFYRVALLP